MGLVYFTSELSLEQKMVLELELLAVPLSSFQP